MPNEVTLTCRLNKAKLPVMATQQLVYVLIEAATSPAMAQVERPLNLSLVLDKSGSMEGAKIQNLREAAKRVVDRLGSDDILSIIAFSDRKYIIAESQPVTDRAALKKQIDRIRDGGGTVSNPTVPVGSNQERRSCPSRPNIGPAGAFSPEALFGGSFGIALH